MHRFFLLAAGFLSLSGVSSAALVITIDISNPAAVVITGVANNSQSAGNLDVNFNGGISFLSFFTANTNLTAERVITGNWTAIGTTAAYNGMVSFVYGNAAVVAGRDLSIYNNIAANGIDQNFVTNAPPFTGSSTVNLSSVANLPAVGTTGNVNIGYQSSQGGVIGQWQVIPEPSSLLIASVGFVSLLRRRR